MRIFALCLLLAACPASPTGDPPIDDDDDATEAPLPTDPLDLADEVSTDGIGEIVAALADLGTRSTFAPANAEARAWIVERMAGYGFVTEEDPFDVNGTEAVNLIARKPGLSRPDRVWIHSAHYDSTSTQPDTLAPGADDNASGVASVLEAARILADRELEESVWFVFTAAEEQGSLGSAHMVEWLLEDDVDVQGVIAPDMIGYWPLGDDDLVDLLGDDESEHLVLQMADVADALGVAHKVWIQHAFCYGDDHTNFQEAGFPALTPMDCVEAHNLPATGESTPHYHRTTDTIDTLHLPFTARVVGLTVATLAELAEVR
jgi:Zn-dependent M28 family amino/carboxypeptidase